MMSGSPRGSEYDPRRAVRTQIYLRVKERAGASGRLAMAAGLFLLTIAMGVGIFGAFMGMWLPRL